MKRDSNLYIFIYASVMVIVVAVLLALAATALRPAQEENVRTEKRLSILRSIGLSEEAESAPNKTNEINRLYTQYITQTMVVNEQGEVVTGEDAFTLDLREELAKPAGQRLLPVFVATLKNGETKYVFPLTGTGLWGPIWGYIALDKNMNTVYGVSFSHKSETPGLGAEIVAQPFTSQFPGKQIFEGSTLVSIDVVKAGLPVNNHSVDGISGGTMTSNGVKAMLLNCLTQYRAYLEAHREGRQ